jgi:hypothetical protein
MFQGPDLFVLKCFFTDPVDQDNYYLTELQLISWVLFPFSMSNELNLLNGNEISIQYRRRSKSLEKQLEPCIEASQKLL